MTKQQIIQASYDFSKAESIDSLVESAFLLKPGDNVLTSFGVELIYLKKVYLNSDLVRHSYFPEHFYLFSNIIGNDEDVWKFEKSLVCLKGSEKLLVNFDIFHNTWEVLTLENIPSPEEDKILLLFDTRVKRAGIVEYYPMFWEKTKTSLVKLHLPTWKSGPIGFDISNISKKAIESKKVKFKVVKNPDK